MNFTINDRLSFKKLYPTRGSLLTNSVIKAIEKKVEPDQEELALLEIKEDGTFLIKNLEKIPPKEIEFTNIEIQELKRWVSEKDNSKDISFEIFNLCEIINDMKKI